MLKLHRDIARKLRAHLPGADITVVDLAKHVKVLVVFDGRTAMAVVAKTPTNPDHEYRNTCNFVCRGLQVPKPRF